MTAHLMGRYRLTTYDPSYLELAMRRGATVATSDGALIAAAQVVGVSLLPIA